MSLATPSVQIVSPVFPGEDSPSYGVFVKNIADALGRAGFRVETRAVVRGRPRGFASRVKAHLGLGLGVATSALRSADCLYVHLPTWFGTLAYASTLPRAKRFVVHLHGAELYPNSPFKKAGRPFLGWVARHADRVVVPSRYFATAVQRECGVPAEHIFVSPSGGVDTTLFAPRSREAARRALGVPQNRRLIGFVGRIFPGKGWDTFLRVLAALARTEDVHGLVVGEGEDSTKLDALARELGVSERITRLGLVAQPELPNVYSALDVLLFPTRRPGESLGLVPIEAMATGTLVVASRGYAVGEYLEHGVSGLLAAADSVNEFTEATARLLSMAPEEAEPMRRAAVAAARKYDTRVVMEGLVAELRAVIARPAAER